MEQWSVSFDRARPTATYTATSTRLALFKSLTIDAQEYYKERVLLNEQYLKSLRKLSSKLNGNGGMTTQLDLLGLEKRELDQGLGSWQGVLRSLERELDELSGQQEIYGKKVMETVEKSLKNSLETPSWSRWNQQDLQLGSLIREYESSKDKLQKAQSKVQSKSSKATSSKLLAAQSQLSSLGSTIASSLPQYLDASQALEMEHTVALKESLTRYGTITADLAREGMELGERFVSTTLGIDEREEMIDWAKRESKRAGAPGVAPQIQAGNLSNGEFGETVGGRTVMDEPESYSEMESLSTPPPVPARQNSSNSTKNLPTLRSVPPPVGSLLLPTNSIPQSIRSNSNSTLPSTQNSGSNAGSTSGFKLSSFLGRDKSSSNGNSKYGNLDAPISDDTVSIQSRAEEEDTFSAAPMKSTQSLKSEKRKSVMPGFGAGGLFRRPSKVVTNTPPPPPPPNRSMSAVSREGSERQGSYSSGNLPSNTANAGSVDADGYSVPPQGYDKQPWESSAGGLMDEEESEDNFDAGVTPKLASIAIVPSNVFNTESDSDRQAALERVKNTLLLSSNGSGSSAVGSVGSMARKTTTSRGRRDQSRNNSYNPTSANVDDVPLAKIIEQARLRELSEETNSTTNLTPSTSTHLEPFTPTTPSVFTQSMLGAGRTGSIVSTASNSNSRNAIDPFAGSELDGLKASIIETVNVLMKAGEVTRVMITGEISLNLRTGESRKSGLKLRIKNYDQFEKTAPNLNFLVPVESGGKGEFELSPIMLKRGFSTVVVFRYQLKIPSGEEMNFIPMKVKTLWKAEEEKKQASLIIYYSINPNSKIFSKLENSSPFGEGEGDGEMNKLADISFHVPISTPITTFQSKPTATYSAEKNRISFAIEPIPFSSSSESKLLARMNTAGDNLITPAPISVRWKINGTFSGTGIEILGDEVEQVQLVESVFSTISGKYLVA